MTIYGLYLQEGTPLALFDGTEVSPVVEFEDGCVPISESDIGSIREANPEANIFWSVYLHHDPMRPENEGFGGVECIADLPTKDAAMAYAAGVDAAIKAVRAAE